MELTREEKVVILGLINRELYDIDIAISRLIVRHACNTTHYEKLKNRQEKLNNLKGKLEK